MDSQESVPNYPGELSPISEPPAWPKVIGILSIAWASLGLTCGACGVGWVMFGTALMPPDMRAQLPPNLTGTPAMWAQMALSIVSQVLLLIAGIAAIRRRPVARVMHLVWAVIAILLWGVGMYLQLGHQEALKQWAVQNPDSPFAKQMNNPAQRIGQTAVLAISVLLGLGYPVFLLVWFGAVKRTPDSWGQPPDDGRAVI